MRIVFIALVSLLAISFGAMAQTTGHIRGLVTDETGALVPGATVTIRSSALIGERTAVSNNSGVYRFPSIPPGVYRVEAKLQGFQTYREENIEVTLNATTSVNITLKLGTVQETVTVSGESPAVDVTKSGLSTNWKNEMVEDLPTNRQVYDWFQMSPGVGGFAPDGQGTRVQAYGGGNQNNAFNVDGIEVTSPDNGAAWWGINPDIVEEVEVMGVGAPAEYGSAIGAHLNVITKSGSNDFHGTGNFFWQTDALTGNNVVAEGFDRETLEPAEFGFHRDEYRDITGTLGGPISRDNAWFFTSFQYRRSSLTQPGIDPSITDFGLVGDPSSENDRVDFKLTTRLTDKHQLDGTFHYEKWRGFQNENPFFTPSATGEMHGNTPAWKAGLTSTFSADTLMEIKYAGWWGDGIWRSFTDSTDDPFIDYAPVGGGPTRRADGIWYPWDYFQWRHQIQANVTNYAEDFLNSQHEFKFGVQWGYGSARTDVKAGPNGNYLTKFYTYGYIYSAVQQPYNYGGTSRNLGVFLDDSITVGERLTLNLGVRYDHSRGNLRDSERLTPDFEPTGMASPGADDIIQWDKVSPRIGFALQTTKDGRGVVRGSFGIYYDQNVMGNWDGQIAERPPINYFWFNSASGDYDIFCCQFAYGTEVLNFDLDPPQLKEYSVGFDQQVSDDVSVGVQYLFRESEDFIGQEILAGLFQPVPFTDPFTGDVITLFNRLQDPLVRRGNTPQVPDSVAPFMDPLPRYDSDYHAVFLSADKRYADNWSLSAAYTWSRARGMFPTMLSQFANEPIFAGLFADGRDINNYVNARGRLQGDRPHTFRLQGVVNLPADFLIATSFNFQTGRPFARQMRVFGLGNPSGSVVTLDPRGTQNEAGVTLDGETLDRLRHPSNKIIDVRIGKRLSLGSEGANIILDGTVFNLLNDDASLSLATQELNSGDEFVATQWLLPRRLMIRVGFEF
jgi:hypothetical protein